jgi:hypothetical protein
MEALAELVVLEFNLLSQAHQLTTLAVAEVLGTPQTHPSQELVEMVVVERLILMGPQILEVALVRGALVVLAS